MWFFCDVLLDTTIPPPENFNRFVTFFNEIAYGIPEEIFQGFPKWFV
jgi:hypothetical protein